ncbi:DUF6351 family protein [Pendulispora brunnea]|uniref:DUF6351 family protein n=1 Tax=Pendulispora brunnea TaxID=2905690 RepID=A0ABZ2K0C0_9BACT
MRVVEIRRGWIALGLFSLVACSPGDEPASVHMHGAREGLRHSSSNEEPETTSVEANFHDRATPPRAPGEFDLVTLSTLPDAVSDGDVLVGLRGLSAGDVYSVTRNGIDVTGAFQRVPGGDVQGLVAELAPGENRIAAEAVGPDGRRRAVLRVINHSITGPILSGPHQTPFVCRTREAGLGDPLDADCSIATQYEWFYRPKAGNKYLKLEDPYAPYPSDVTLVPGPGGTNVPLVVRVESSTINRGITRIAVLDDPHARGPAAPFQATRWNHRVYYAYGALCGVGYHQGVNRPETVLDGISGSPVFDFHSMVGVDQRLRKGDIVVHSTLSTFGVQCNPLVSIETTMMVKEHIAEKYGSIAAMIGTGGSGAAVQQYNAINNAPGLLNGALPIASLADVWSTMMTIADCGLLTHYYDTYAPNWEPMKRAHVEGHAPLLGIIPREGICKSWSAPELRSVLDPQRGCDPSVPEAMRYHPVNNPHGVRCTIQDTNVNLLGREPVTGFARRPLDNVGVQYGLAAFNMYLISAAEFLDLNRNIGGFDMDGRYVHERMAMSPEVESILYRTGMVIGRGSLSESPIVDMGLYLDQVPGASIHDAVRPFIVRNRLRSRVGLDGTQSIWRGNAVAPPEAYPILEQWLAPLSALPHGTDRARAIVAAKPAGATDRCVLLVSGTRTEMPENFDTGRGPCSAMYPVGYTPRMVAGMPASDDVVRCQLKPLVRSDYRATFTDAEFDELKAIFPNGVCDYSKRAAQDVEKSLAWPSIGGEAPHAPVGLSYRAARSMPVP